MAKRTLQCSRRNLITDESAGRNQEHNDGGEDFEPRRVRRQHQRCKAKADATEDNNDEDGNDEADDNAEFAEEHRDFQVDG